jgi:hypothetical protein
VGRATIGTLDRVIDLKAVKHAARGLDPTSPPLDLQGGTRELNTFTLQ